MQRFLRVGPTLGGGVRPGRADGAWPSPCPAQRVIFSKSRPQARPGLGDSNPMRRRPAPASEFPISLVVCPAWLQDIFAVSSCCVPFSPRFRGSNVLVSPGPATSLGSRSLSTIGIRRRLCHAPIPAFGYRWCGVGSALMTHISSHDKMSRIEVLWTKCLESRFYVFGEKPKKSCRDS